MADGAVTHMRFLVNPGQEAALFQVDIRHNHTDCAHQPGSAPRLLAFLHAQSIKVLYPEIVLLNGRPVISTSLVLRSAKSTRHVEIPALRTSVQEALSRTRCAGRQRKERWPCAGSESNCWRLQPTGYGAAWSFRASSACAHPGQATLPPDALVCCKK